MLTPEGTEDYNNPLQLLAKSMVFTDPLTGKPIHIESSLKLRALDTI